MLLQTRIFIIDISVSSASHDTCRKNTENHEIVTTDEQMQNIVGICSLRYQEWISQITIIF